MCKVDVFVPEGHKFGVNLYKKNLQDVTVGGFKEELLKILTTPGYTKENVSLHAGGKPLDDDTAPLSKCGIKPDSTLQMVRKVHGG
ncbi:unnamed protein product [Oreochromis niloticus]|nr:unnamed protein product [Mustela putorius furo]